MNEYTHNQQLAIEQLNRWKVGALFMEAGTGKTRVALTLVNSTACTDVFWIAPLRTITNAKEEIAKWGGFKMAAHYYGVESIGQSNRIFLEAMEQLERAENPFIVVDESLKIKNVEAKRTQRILELGRKAQWKLVLNGTPISRNLMDMWPQMEFLSPKILNMSVSQFKNTFCKWTKITKRIGNKEFTKEYITGMENVDYLHSLIRHYIYECDMKLNVTQKWHTIDYVIGEQSKKDYTKVKEKYLSDEMLEWRNNNIFMAMTTEMQMAYALDDAKFKAIKKLFENGVGKKTTIIFCRWIASQEQCKKLFPDCKVLSLQKESLGLNLQQYKTTIYFDKIWDYALYLQSTRRTYRTGQESDCEYYELTGDVGLERMIDNNIRKKVTMSEYLKKISKEQLIKEL